MPREVLSCIPFLPAGRSQGVLLCLCTYLGLPQPKFITLNLALLNHLRFIWAHLLRFVKVPLGDIPSFCHINYTIQLGFISKLAEGALIPTIYVIDKDVKE